MEGWEGKLPDGKAVVSGGGAGGRRGRVPVVGMKSGTGISL